MMQNENTNICHCVSNHVMKGLEKAMDKNFGEMYTGGKPNVLSLISSNIFQRSRRQVRELSADQIQTHFETWT